MNTKQHALCKMSDYRVVELSEVHHIFKTANTHIITIHNETHHVLTSIAEYSDEDKKFIKVLKKCYE